MKHTLGATQSVSILGLIEAADAYTGPSQDQASYHSRLEERGVEHEPQPLTGDLWTCDGFLRRESEFPLPLIDQIPSSGWPHS